MAGPTAQLNIVYPMLFQIRNDATGLSTHCGVLEFVAEEGRAYLPQWVGTGAAAFLVSVGAAELSGGVCRDGHALGVRR